MRTRIALVPVLVLLPLWAIDAHAHDAPLEQCARIASAVDRLDCYDALAAAAQPATPPVPTVAAPGPRPVTPAAPAAPSAPAQAAAVAQPAENFGFESRRRADSAQEIRSRYDGEFSGWSGKTLFKLENGQVWKQTEKSRMVLHASRPEITIRKGLFGSFVLSVEGTKKSVRVKRIK